MIIQQSNDAKMSNTDQLELMQKTMRDEKKKLDKVEEKY